MSITEKTQEIQRRTEMLERRANIVRSRLLRAVDALDARRHQVERIGEHAKSLALPSVLGGVAVLALLGASAYTFSVALKKRRRPSLGERVVTAIRGLELAPRPSFARRAAERVAFSVLTYAATELVRQAATNVVDGRGLDGRLAVGRALESHREELATT